MTSGIKFYLYIILIPLITFSCYREEDIKPLVCNDCTKPVVLCFIGPGDSIYAFATNTTAFGEAIDKVKVFDGKISIYDTTGRGIDLVRYADKPNFFAASQSKFSIQPGNKYRLEVAGTNGRSIAYTTVPAIADTIKSADIIGTQEDEDGLWYLTKVSWENSAKTNNLVGHKEYVKEKEGSFNIINYGDEFNLLGNNKFEFTSFSSVLYWQHTTYSLYTIDKEFDKYLKSYVLFYNLGVSLDSNSVVEMFNGIIPQYSNFDNCYGVFGSYLTDTVTVFNPEK